MALRNQHVLDGIEDALLSVARQLTDFLENATGFARRSAARLAPRRADHHFIGACAEDLRELGNLIGPQRDIAALPKWSSPE